MYKIIARSKRNTIECFCHRLDDAEVLMNLLYNRGNTYRTEVTDSEGAVVHIRDRGGDFYTKVYTVRKPTKGRFFGDT